LTQIWKVKIPNSNINFEVRKFKVHLTSLFAKVEASQSETRIETEMLKRKIDDMNATVVTKGEVKKNVEEHVVELRDMLNNRYKRKCRVLTMN